ncbi:MAG: hypothetical protein R3C49_17335 [Planctomycetaceae bacterium]
MSTKYCWISAALSLFVAFTSDLRAQYPTASAPYGVGVGHGYLPGYAQPGYGYDQPVYGQPGYRWDYRFDAQYQSTIKPYLRWYMRPNPATRGDRYLPRTYGQTAGYGTYGAEYFVDDSSNCCSCGMGYGMPMFGGYGTFGRSIYWQHLSYLYHLYGNTPIVRQGLDTYRAPAPPETPAIDPPLLPTSVAPPRDIWISRDSATGAVSMLFVEPPAAQAEQFFKGTAVLDKQFRIVSLKWSRRPNWASEISVAKAPASAKGAKGKS